MPTFKSVVHLFLVDFGGGSCSCCSCCYSCCDRGKTKSTPSLTRLRLEFDNFQAQPKLQLSWDELTCSTHIDLIYLILPT